MAALLGPAYAYMLGAVVWIRRWNPQRRFIGLSRIGWLITISAAYALGAGAVVLMGML